MGLEERQKVVLIIVDGFGIASPSASNAITQANTPTWDSLRSKYPHTAIKASGNNVGLPEGIMGNSEVGHLTIGTGRITFQSLERINQAIKSDSIKDNQTLITLTNHVRKSGGDIHLMGLLSDGKVHSDQAHLHHLIDILSPLNTNIWVHAFTDGRDTPTDSAPKYIKLLFDHINDKANVELASVVGRYYAMDRDKKWDRTKIAYDLLVHRFGNVVEDVFEEIGKRYDKGETDEFLKPIKLTDNGAIKDGDAVLFYNFRTDRPRQITEAINYQVEFETKSFENLFYATMTVYDDDWNFPTIFPQEIISDSLAEVVAKAGLLQLHIAETEKYAHVTYFLNGGIEDPFENEDRILIPSSKVATYDMKPEMSTPQIVDAASESIQTEKYQLVVINIACADMVGHTGNLQATIKAVEAMDKGFEIIYEACQNSDYYLIITSDHGNAEKMIENGEIHTAHTTNNVPFLVTIPSATLRSDGGLKHVAPTVLQLMGIPIPKSMIQETMLNELLIS